MLEYLSIILALTTAATATMAFFYRQGKKTALSDVNDTTIKQDIIDIKKSLREFTLSNKKEHDELEKTIKGICDKINKIQGESEIIRELITNHLRRNN